jgi:hypothetical protein
LLEFNPVKTLHDLCERLVVEIQTPLKTTLLAAAGNQWLPAKFLFSDPPAPE